MSPQYILNKGLLYFFKTSSIIIIRRMTFLVVLFTFVNSYTLDKIRGYAQLVSKEEDYINEIFKFSLL